MARKKLVAIALRRTGVVGVFVGGGGVGLSIIDDPAQFGEPQLPDCKPAPCDIDERQSWQKMNRGMSKKQRRNHSGR